MAGIRMSTQNGRNSFFMSYTFQCELYGILLEVRLGSERKCPGRQHSLWNVQIDTKDGTNSQGIKVYMFSVAKD